MDWEHANLLEKSAAAHHAPASTRGNLWKTCRLLSTHQALPWYLVCILVACVVLLRLSNQQCAPLWQNTDFTPARSEIELEEVSFRAGLRFNENGTLYRTFDPDGTTYVGEPSDELDSHWEAIARPQDVFVLSAEAATIDAEMYQYPGFGLYETEKHLFRDYYSELVNKKTSPIHLEHCLEALRESLMCHGDMTPMPVIWSEGRQGVVPDFERTHTCRNFEKLLAWAKTRDANTDGLADENLRRLQAEERAKS